MPSLNLKNITIKKLEDRNFNPYYLIVNNDNQDEAFFCFEKTVREGWTDLANNYENIKEVEIDFADLFTKFPNLAGINLQNNPISAKNLNNLTNQQFNQLKENILDHLISQQKYLLNTKQSGEALELLNSCENNSASLVFLDSQYEPVRNVMRTNYPLFPQSGK